MKKIFIALFFSLNANALEWSCGNEIHLLSIGDTDKTRPSLFIRSVEHEDGSVTKIYRQLQPMNEKSADFLLSLEQDTQNICFKAYVVPSTRFNPLSIYDIEIR